MIINLLRTKYNHPFIHLLVLLLAKGTMAENKTGQPPLLWLNIVASMLHQAISFEYEPVYRMLA